MSISFTSFRKFIPLLLLFIGFLQTTVQAQCPGTLAATATPTTVLCPNRGRITVSATGGVGIYNYQITLPTIGTPQTSNVFTALDSGTYTVEISDQNCTIAITNIIVTDSYIPMVLTTAGTVPTCPGANDGIITATVVGGSNAGAKQYKLLTGTTTIAGPQTSNVFTGRAPGVYTVSVEDTCGEVRTNVFTLGPAIDYSFYAFPNRVFQAQSAFYNPPYPGDGRGKAWPYSITCDSVATRLSAIMIPTGTLPRPVTITVQQVSTGLTVYTATIPVNTATNAAYTLTEAHLAKGQQYRIIYSDNCNEIDTALYTPVKVGITTEVMLSCSGATLAVHTGGYDGTPNYNLFTCRNQTFTVISGPNMIGSSVTDTLGDAYFPGAITGTYQIRVAGCCAIDTVSIFVFPRPSVTVLQQFTGNDACYDNTAIKTLRLNYEYVSPTPPGSVTWRLLSGPTSFTDVKNVVHTITYPVTYNKVMGTGDGSQWVINNMPQGTYTAQATDVCGTLTPIVTFTVTAADVTIHNTPVVTASLICNNATITVSNLISGQRNTAEIVKITNLTTNTVVFTSLFYLSHPTETVSNLPPGNYRIQVYKHLSNFNPYTYLISDTTCNELFFTKDTLLQYRLPVLDSVVINRCATNPVANARVYGTLGNTPYQYEIISGPVTTALQSSAIFPNLPVGTYTFGFMDACGNEVVTSVQVDTPNRLFMTDGPINCHGRIFTIGITPYPGFAYSWTGPTGFVNPGTPTITFNPYDSATQKGTYTVTVSSPGYNASPSAQTCPSFARSITLTAICSVTLPIELISFTATALGNCTALLQWQTASEKNSSSFAIEYSKDGNIFSTAGSVPAAGSSNAIKNYSYRYSIQQSGVTYFRLREMDNDGHNSYSKIVSVASDCEAGIIVSPNPVIDNLTIAGLTGGESIRIYNVTGQQVAYIKNAGQSNFINTSAYTKGIYAVQVLNADGSMRAFVKVVKQ